MVSRFIPIVAGVNTSFLFIVESYSTVWIDQFLIHLRMDIWANSTFSLLWVMLLQTVVYKPSVTWY